MRFGPRCGFDPTIDRSRASGRLSLVVFLACLLLSQPGCSNWKAARLYQSGSRALEKNDPARAISDLERAASLKPDSSRIQNHLGIAYEQSGQQNHALYAFRRAVALDCENAAAAENLSALRGEMASQGRPEGPGPVLPEEMPDAKTFAGQKRYP